MVDSVRLYEIKGEVCTLSTAALAAGVANNQQIVAAVSGKRIRVMGWIVQGSAAGFGSFQLKSNSGGTVLMAPLIVPNNAAGLCDKLPVVDSGYMETSTGHGLFVDVVTAALSITIFYIIYTP